MGVPKRKTSKMRQRMRQFANRFRAPQPGKCSNCSSPKIKHTVCPTCGYYAGRQVLILKK